jgi:hypothetical protein
MVTTEEIRKSLNLFLKEGQTLHDIAKTADRARKSLSGDNFYGNKFQGTLVSFVQSENRLTKALRRSHIEEPSLSRFRSFVSTLKSTSTKPRQKSTALKELQLLCESDILPRLEDFTADPTPQTEQVLPLSVVSGTRDYLERVILQANGCYEHQWFDACSVMIRRFVETLIIEVYEATGRDKEIKDNNGDFLMLRELVATILSDTSWNLSRQTKKALPEIKELGDRSAHNRRYLAKKQYIDNVTSGLRLVAADLLHLAKLK